jgi:myo-inositol-1(or 4)-monophosphatase
VKDILINALKEAGRIQKESFYKTHGIEIKESISSIVTEVDVLCDKIISEIICQKFPSHNILTEENGLTFHHSEYTWVVDPLDGTSNYAAGIPWFGVLIALFKNDLPILAGAYLPMEDLLYFAETGKGTDLNGSKITIENVELKNSLAGFATDYSDNTDFIEYGMELYRFLVKNTRNIRCTNSLVDFMMVADGRMGGTINLFTKIWDIAAPWLILKEAGGSMKDIYNREIKFVINQENIALNYPVVAGSFSFLGEMALVLKSI